MVKIWLNHFVDKEGKWVSGQPDYFKSSKSGDIGGKNVRLYETSVGGSVLLSPSNKTLTSYGIAEVYLKIFFSTGQWCYLSAPLRTPIDLQDVKEIELNLLITVGNPACDEITYRAFVNGHCVYELISLPSSVGPNSIGLISSTGTPVD